MRLNALPCTTQANMYLHHKKVCALKATKNICQLFFNCSTLIVLTASLRTDVLVHIICCQQPLRQNRCLPWRLSESLCLVHYLLNVEFLFLFLIPVHETFPTKRLTFVSIRQELNASLRKSAKQNTSLFFAALWFLILVSSKKRKSLAMCLG